jgi:hypothetical protein
MHAKPTGGGCRVCGDPDTIEAHLFPRALGHDIRGTHKHLFVGATAVAGRRIVQAGLFDRGILCSTHEAALGQFDDYGIDFCRNFAANCQHPAPDIWQVNSVDSDKLVRFWLAILWRFSVSTLIEAAKVKLGPFEAPIRNILFSNAPCNVEPAIFMLRYRSRVIPPENICFPPYLSVFPGVPLRLRAYGMAVGGFHAFVKVDSRSLPSVAHELTINGKMHVTGGYLEFEGTQQFQRAKQIARNMKVKPTAAGRWPSGR